MGARLSYRGFRSPEQRVGERPASPFSSKSESLTLRNFSEAEVAELYGQHTAVTGQAFEPEATARAYAKLADPLTKGLEQLDCDLARLGLDAGWLVIFDRRSP